MSLSITPTGISSGGEFDFYGKRYASYSKTIEIFSVTNENSYLLSTITPPSSPITSLVWSQPSNGNFIAFTSFNTLFIYQEISPNTWEQVFSNSDHSGSLTSIAWAPENLELCLLVGSQDKTISLFAYKSHTWAKSTHAVHVQPILSVSWLYHAKTMTFITHAETIKVWQYVNHSLELIQEINERFLDVKACPSNSLIAGCNKDFLVIFYKDEGFARVQVNVGGNYVQWSAYGNILLLGSEVGVRVLRRFPSEAVRWEVVQIIKEDGELELVA